MSFPYQISLIPWITLSINVKVIILHNFDRIDSSMGGCIYIYMQFLICPPSAFPSYNILARIAVQLMRRWIHVEMISAISSTQKAGVGGNGCLAQGDVGISDLFRGFKKLKARARAVFLSVK